MKRLSTNSSGVTDEELDDELDDEIGDGPLAPGPDTGRCGSLAGTGNCPIPWARNTGGTVSGMSKASVVPACEAICAGPASGAYATGLMAGRPGIGGMAYQGACGAGVVEFASHSMGCNSEFNASCSVSDEKVEDELDS
jgi:hypothetical protein